MDRDQSDETDIKRVLSFMKKKAPEDVTRSSTNCEDLVSKISANIPTIPAPNADCYDMNHKNRGTALIFNHYKFDKPNYLPRKGTDRDCERIEKTLKALKFQTLVQDDLKFGQIQSTITAVAEADHTDNDCLVVVVMTHGDPDILHARDECYYIDALWKPFTGNRCPTLVGKPKLFFIQACRGDKTDPGVECKVEFDGVLEKPSYVVKIPSMADFLFMYPTSMDNYSFRSPQNGSWFIQSLCEELMERGKHQDLQTILTFVNRRMAFGYQSNVPTNHELHGKKQVGSMVSSLTRLMYFL